MGFNRPRSQVYYPMHIHRIVDGEKGSVLYGPRSTDIDVANAEVVRRLDESVPVLVDVALAGNVVPGMLD